MFGQRLSVMRRDTLITFSLAVNDFRRRHAGSYFGILWSFVQPMITIAVLWFVFEMGLRAQAVKGAPFLIWLVCGLVPWFYFSEALAGATNSLLEYNYLVKKIVFKVSLLPIVKILSAAFVHFIFLAILLALISSSQVGVYVSLLQIPYYIFATTCLITALAYITVAVTPFFRDLSQVVAIGLQFGMWLTPIMWDSTQLPVKYQFLVQLNPMRYVVEGYRDAVLDRGWFWDKPNESLYFWLLVLIIGAIGRSTFRRLRPHFADVL